MTENEIWGLAGVLAIFFLPFAFLFLNCRRRARVLAKTLPIQWGWWRFDTRKSGTVRCAGVPCHFDYYNGIGFYPSIFKLSIDAAAFGHFDIASFPDAGNWLVKKMRIMTGYATGDIHFDEKYSVASVTPRLTALFLRNPDNRKLIEDIFGLGFNSIHFDAKQLTVQWNPFLPFYQRKPPPSFVEEAVRLMLSLSRQIAEASKQMGNEGKSPEGIREWTQGVRAQLWLLLAVGFVILFLLVKYFFVK